MIRTTAAIAAATIASASLAGTTLFNFEGLQHGEIVDSQFSPSLTISGINNAKSFDLVASFDTNLTGTADDDLEGPPWSGGNLAIDADNVDLGNVLILSTNDDGAGDGILDDPNDEGARPAGSITFTFSSAIGLFGFDLVDIEGVILEASMLEFSLNGQSVGSVSLTDFVDTNSSFYDSSVVFGNNYANRFSPITAADLGSVFDEVTLNLGGSGAIDNILIPAPGALALVGLGGLVATRRRR